MPSNAQALPLPHLILIHGSWHSPAIWSTITPLLSHHSHVVHCPFNPSVSEPVFHTTHHTDAANIASLASRLADEGHDIILVMHSYGGVPGTESAKGLLKRDRHAEAKPGGIVGLVYLSAFLLAEGQCVADMMDGNVYDDFEVTDGRVSPPEIRFCYSDLPREEAEGRHRELQSMSLAAWESRLEYESYREVPSTYLMCTEDLAIPFEKQEQMLKRAGGSIVTEVCGSGHSPMLKMPEKVVEVIRRAAGEDSSMS